jgi:hypothetical protein
MITETHNGITYTGRNSLDIALQVAADKEDAKRRQRRYNRRPYRGQGCSEDRKLRQDNLS